MNKKKIYVVIGMAGSEDTFERWIVCAYESKALAHEHCRNAQREANNKANTKNSYDPFFRRIGVWSTGYDFEETWLLENLQG